MQCPFETPVKKLEYEDPRISRDPERFLIVSPDGEFSLKRCNEKCADYIVQAINCHEKLVELLKYPYNLPMNEAGAYDENVEWKKAVEQALKEAEK